MDYIKNKVNNATMSVMKNLVAPPTVTQFLDKGTLTAEEFIQAGDKLIANCGAWKWYPAVDPKYATKYLPENKQFLGIENVVSVQRCKDLNSQCELIINDTEDDVIITKNQQQQQIEQIDKQAEDRFYNLYICYDLYYFTPRLYLAGKDDKGHPLDYEKVKQDINSEYADKTVTEEYHPHLNIYLPTIHPCRHADTLKFLTSQMIENGAQKEKIHADNSILIFLKFMGSVIPTIQFDFVSEIVIG